jgi:hypothetical protein
MPWRSMISPGPSLEGAIRSMTWQVSWLLARRHAWPSRPVHLLRNSGTCIALPVTVAGQLPNYTEFPFQPGVKPGYQRRLWKRAATNSFNIEEKGRKVKDSAEAPF